MRQVVKEKKDFQVLQDLQEIKAFLVPRVLRVQSVSAVLHIFYGIVNFGLSFNRIVFSNYNDMQGHSPY